MTQDYRHKLTRADLKWFSVEPYEAARGLTAREWAEQLNLRKLMFVLAEPPMREALDVAGMVVELLRAPLRKTDNALLSLPRRGPTVSDLTIDQVYNMRYALDGLPVLEQCIAYEKEREGDDLSVPNLPWQKYRSVIGQSFDDYVRENEIFHAGTQVNVDLNASDSEILADFKDWLAQKRRAAGSMAAKRRTDNKDFESWVKNRVLPYIDLLLLSQATGRPLTHSLAGELLFWDEDVDATEKVRKTVRPLAMQLLDSQFIAAIERQPDGVEGKS